jgi:TRAP-type mannitol/chloroaromatic compound transport system permease small subunit
MRNNIKHLYDGQEVYTIKKILTFLGNGIEGTNRWVGRVVAFLILPLLVITLYGVVMRYVFKAPPDWGTQVLLLLFTPMAILPAGYVLSTDSHIKLDLLYVRFSPRGKAISDMVTYLGALFYAVILSIAMIKDSVASTLTGQSYVVESFKGPIYPKKIVFAVAFILLLLEIIVVFFRKARFVAKGTKEETT